MMESGAVPPATTAKEEVYIGWEELYVCSEKGRREIHYILKRKDGGSDLAVIAKEKSLRHMTYRFLLDVSSLVKPKSRREVVDWLNSFTPDSPSPVVPQMSGCSIDGNETDALDVETLKATQLQKLGHYTKEFLWLGSQWTCKKRRKHYQAFCRNGIKISVNQFVHVLAEKGKRLVAYLDDMYEDMKGSKMVVVRWFHKIDEVGIDLPHNFNDREIFFSLCLQDLSIECIDGLATVLSPAHYDKFVSEAGHTLLQPYVCCQQYTNDDVKPLNITQVKGYWEQDVVRYMFSLSSVRTMEDTILPDIFWKKEDVNDVCGNKPRKRLRLSRDGKVDLQCGTVIPALVNINVIGHTKFGSSPGVGTFLRKENMECVAPQIAAGSVVEVLSQDSGMRGCWFRATVIKKHKNKVKLRYLDIKDAENDVNSLEEWVLASRISVQDEMGIRLDGRTAIRPSVTHNGKVSWIINVGSIVDAWWHDGWWEGIVIQKECNEKLRVYFPGEKREAGFSRCDLRHSQEWLGGIWKDFSERKDVAASILSDLVKEGKYGKFSSDKCLQALLSSDKHLECDEDTDFLFGTQDCSSIPNTIPSSEKFNSSAVIDLSKDDFLSRLKWKSSHKRKRSGFVVRKLQRHRSYGINFERAESPENHQEFLIPPTLKVRKDHRKSVKVDRDNCKCIRDSLFSPSVVQSLTNLVMSR